MSPVEIWQWFSSDTGLLALFARNWLLGSAMIAAILFIETGVVVMPFLPGDSLLFAAGALLGVSDLSAVPVVAIAAAGAIAGDAVNYAVGRSRIGRALERSRWIKPRHLDETRRYFERYGGLTVTIARFVPVVRTVAPFLAGLSGMKPRRFFAFNVAGGVLWCAGMIYAGFWLGQVPWVRDHIQWMSLVIVAVSLVPVGIQLARARSHQPYRAAPGAGTDQADGRAPP